VSSAVDGLRRAAVAFARFWVDFLVGETPELLVGTLAVVALVAVVAHGLSSRAAAVIAFPVLVAAVLLVSVLRGARGRRE